MRFPSASLGIILSITRLLQLRLLYIPDLNQRVGRLKSVWQSMFKTRLLRFDKLILEKINESIVNLPYLDFRHPWRINCNFIDQSAIRISGVRLVDSSQRCQF